MRILAIILALLLVFVTTVPTAAAAGQNINKVSKLKTKVDGLKRK